MDLKQLRRRSADRRVEAFLESRRYCELQGDQSIANQAGASFRSDLNNELQALATVSSGAAAPATTYQYQFWADTANSLLKQRNAANTGWLVRGTLKESFVQGLSGTYNVLNSDWAQTFKCSGTFSLTFTAAATLGDGFMFYVMNASSGVITLDPNGAEQIDNATTVTLAQGDGCAVFCNGAAFFTIGRRPSTSSTLKNWVIDGQIQASKVGPVATLTTSPQYGKSLMHAGWASGGAISAGTLTIDTAATIGSVGRAVQFANCTLTGAGVLSDRMRIHSSRAVQLKNQTLSFNVTALHDVGSNINFTVVVRKPTAQDNYTGVTVIATSGATSVPSATGTSVPFSGIAVGDCSFGLEIEVQAAVGAVTTKNVRLSDFVLNVAASVGSWQQESREEADRTVGYYVNSTFPDGTSPQQNVGSAAGAFQAPPANTSSSVFGEFEWPFLMLGTPTLTTYNPLAANANWRDITNSADRVWAAPADLNNRHVGFGSTTTAANAIMAIHLFADCRL